ncbi:50S ribosomal protein L17 [Patescibacteria group bacterium]|nr:50S ribosomal protein L17 [Patescibacteria group bacterium]
MKHRKKDKKLGRDKSSRRSLTKNLVKSFFLYEQLKTTEAKAKFIKPVIERLITLGKNNNLHTRRLLIKKTDSRSTTNLILNKISPKYKGRQGGYTRITKINNRQGDGAVVVVLTLVENDEKK